MNADSHSQLDDHEPTKWTPVRIASAVAIVVAVAAGVWARVSGLGFSALAADEYYFVSSIKRIMATGLPGFESGGYYIRGWLLQYLTVPAMWVAGADELGVRIPSAIFGLGTAVVGYLYVRRHADRPWALALAAMLLLSSWEIEFSRFGRMYAGFQFFTLALLASLHDVIEGARGWKRYLPALLCLAAVGTHALAVFLLPLMLLPVLLPGRVERLGGRSGLVAYIASLAAPVAAALVSRKVNFRTLGVENARPADFISRAGTESTMPALPFWDLGSPEASLAAVGLLAVLIALASWWLLRRRPHDEAVIIASACLACAVGHVLLIGALLGLLLIVRYGLPRTASQHPVAFRMGLAALAVALGWIAYAAWLTYGLGSRAWIEGMGEQLFSAALLRTFVWPDPTGAVLSAWFAELPRLAWLFAAALAYQFVARARGPLREIVRNPAFFVAYILLALGMFSPALETTRYTYFVYPLALAMLVLTVRDVTNRSVVIGVPVALTLFALGGDFSPNHIASVSTYESTYRIGEFQDREVTWYRRDDEAATAAFVTEAAGPGDAVIVAESPVISHYLHREHAVYLDRRGHRFSNVSRERGTKDLWSNQRLLGSPEEVAEFTHCVTGSVWVVRTLVETRWLDPDTVWDEQLAGVETAYKNPDGSQDVLRVTLNRAEDCMGGTDE